MAQPRFRYQSTLSHGYFPPGVKWLLIANAAVYVVSYLFRLQGPVGEYLALSADKAVRTFMVWQVFTYMFVHFGMWHLMFNMLALWMFGVPIEQSWGTRRFLKFYFSCGVAAGVCVLIANMAVGDWRTITLGASGSVFGVLVAFGILFPDAILLMFFLFPMRAKYAVMIYVAVELLATFGPNTGVSTIAHLGGAAFAYFSLNNHFAVRKLRLPDLRGAYRQWKLQRAKKKFQVYMKRHGKGPWVN